MTERAWVAEITGYNLQADWTVAEMQRTRPGTLVMFDHDIARLPDLRAQLPDPLRVCLRVFGDPRNPGPLIQNAYDLATRYLSAGDAVVLGNEWNLENGMTPAEIAHWSVEHANAWRAKGWPFPLVTPALSPSAPNGNCFPELRDAWALYDFIGLHCYQTADHHVDTYRQVWPDKWGWVTEYNSNDPARQAAYAKDFANLCAGRQYIVGVNWFLWATSDPAQWSVYVARGTAVEQELTWIGQATAPPYPGRPPGAPGGGPTEPPDPPDTIDPPTPVDPGIAAIEDTYNISHTDGAEIVLVRLAPRPDPPSITAHGPADLKVRVATKDDAYHAEALGKAEMNFSQPAIYYPTRGETGWYYATCGDARVEGLGWAYGVPGDTGSHTNVEVYFERRATPVPPDPTPPGPNVKEELRQYAAWADQVIHNEPAPTLNMLRDTDRFQAHLAALGVPESGNIRRYGWPG